MKLISLCLIALSLSAFAADKCPASLTAWTPTTEDKAKFVAKIAEHTGEGKMFEGFDNGNTGMHAFLLPPESVAHVAEIATVLQRRSRGVEKLKDFDPAIHRVVALVETDDEPLVSLILFTKDQDEALRVAYRLEPVDGETEQMRKLVPAAWETSDYEYHHVVWEMVHRGEDLMLPHEYPTHGWTIENYR